MLPLIQLSLIILYPVSIALVLAGRGAIVSGNWLRHKNFMLPAIMLAVMSIAASFIWFALAWPLALNPAIWALLLIHIAAMAGLGVLLPWTLYRVARHLLLPHKLMARWTIRVWILMSASGTALHALMLLPQ